MPTSVLTEEYLQKCVSLIAADWYSPVDPTQGTFCPADLLVYEILPLALEDSYLHRYVLLTVEAGDVDHEIELGALPPGIENYFFALSSAPERAADQAEVSMSANVDIDVHPFSSVQPGTLPLQSTIFPFLEQNVKYGDAIWLSAPFAVYPQVYADSDIVLTRWPAAFPTAGSPVIYTLPRFRDQELPDQNILIDLPEHTRLHLAVPFQVYVSHLEGTLPSSEQFDWLNTFFHFAPDEPDIMVAYDKTRTPGTGQRPLRVSVKSNKVTIEYPQIIAELSELTPQLERETTVDLAEYLDGNELNDGVIFCPAAGVGVFWAEVDSIQQCLKITIKIDGLDFKGAPQDVSLTVVLKCFPRADEGRLLWDIEPEIGIQEGFWNKLLAQVLVGVVHTLSLGFWTLFDEEQNKVKQAVSTLGGVSGSKALLYDQLYRRRNDFRDLASVHP